MTKRTDFGGFGDVAGAFNQQEPGDYHSPWIFDWLKELVGKPARDANVLEVGCGTGTLVRHLARAGFDLVVGIDPDPRMIAIAKKVTEQRCLCVPTSDMPFPAAEFDVVFVHYAFEHFCHDAESIAEVKRVLRKSGILMTVTWPITGWNRRRNEVILQFAVDTRKPLPHHHLVEIGYADLLKELGFHNVETRRRKVTIKYTMEEAKRHVRGSSFLSCVPQHRLPDAYRALDELCEREADVNNMLSRELDVIVDVGRR